MSEFTTYEDLIKQVLKYPVVKRVTDDIGNIDSFQNIIELIALMELRDKGSTRLIEVLQKASEDWKETAQAWKKIAQTWEKTALTYKRLLDLK